MTQVEPLEHFFEGEASSKTLLVFLQGWPDNNRMWDWIDWRKELSQSRILFINFPNTTPTQTQLSWGEDFPVTVDRIYATLQLAGDSFDNKVLVAHDWGCVYGYIFDKKFPRYFSEIVAMDVPAYVELTTVSQKLMVFAYQLFLVVAFLIGGRIGKFMTQKFASVSRHNPPYFGEIDASRNYPYYYFYRNMLASKLDASRAFLHGYTPSVPITYLYAKKKPFQFHGQRWIHYLQTTPGCESQGFDAGHWFMKKFNSLVVQIIKRKAYPRI